MSNPNALRDAIQTKLTEIAQSGRFFEVRYANGKPVPVDPSSTEAAVKPTSNTVNEIGSEFAPDNRFGRDVAQRRTSWRFEQRLDFPREVDISEFEDDVTRTVPRVPKTEQHTFAFLRLTSAEYEHPARGGSSGGSSVILTWEASIGR